MQTVYHILVGFVVLLLGMSLLGCGAYNRVLKRIPNCEFETFSYDRTGNVTSCHIKVTKATIHEGVITFDDVEATGDYGPAFSYKLHITKYSRIIESVPLKSGSLVK